MDLRRLSHFIALAEEGRFAPAANRVHLSQAAFSRSIQALEEQAGMTLVDRGPHGITLTQAGEVVLRRARELVFDSSCLMRDLALMKAGEAGELVIGAGPVPAATIVPALLVELRQQCPQVVNRLRFGKLPQLLTQLDAQEIDVCLGDPRQMVRNERYAMIPVGKQFGGLYCRAGHPLLRKGEVNAESLSHYGIALISTSAALMDSLASDFGFASGAQVPLAVECDDIAMLAFLKKAERKDVLIYVHAGWASALAAGGITWAVATYLVGVSGASRELTEGFSSLFAAVVLLGVGMWMHQKSVAGRWQVYLKEKLSSALNKRTAWFLFSLAFVAVYREVFETVLFFAALWTEGNGWPLLAGLGTGMGILALLAVVLLRTSARLPIGQFFAASSLLVAILAVVLAGKGIAGLQEAGLLQTSPISIPRIDLLGIYPSWQTLSAQFAVLFIVVVAFTINLRSSRQMAVQKS